MRFTRVICGREHHPTSGLVDMNLVINSHCSIHASMRMGTGRAVQIKADRDGYPPDFAALVKGVEAQGGQKMRFLHSTRSHEECPHSSLARD